jgi:UDP-glucose 4-epimerase
MDRLVRRAKLSNAGESKMLQSVLVSGGAGYIGSHAVLALRDAGIHVAVVDNLSTGRRSAVPDGVDFYEGDIADGALIDSIARETGVRAIFHFAGSIIVPDSVRDPLDYYRNNTVASWSLIESAVRNRIDRFVFSSTATIYGMCGVSPIPETAPLAPINPYGRSKLMTEMILEDVAAATPLRFAALRYFNVAGADPHGRSGQSTPTATHLIKVAAQAALGQRDRVMIYGDDYPTPDGTGVRDYIHVSDLADAHLAALRALDVAAGNLVLNIGYGRGSSVIDVLDAVDRVARAKLVREVAARREGDPATLVADTTRTRGTLDWTPRFADLDTIVAHALAWERHLLARHPSS